MILIPLQKLPKNGGDWGKIIVAKGFKKPNKSPNLVTLGLIQMLEEHKVYLVELDRMYISLGKQVRL